MSMNNCIWASAWDFQQCGMYDQQSLRSACAYAQSDQRPCQSLEYSMIVKLPTEHHLEFLSLKGGCRGSSESTLVKMSNCWKSHALAHIMQCTWTAIDIYKTADCILVQEYHRTSSWHQMGESYQEYSWIQDFGAGKSPQIHTFCRW